jgi:molybdate transport system substrate-binding protein
MFWGTYQERFVTRFEAIRGAILALGLALCAVPFEARAERVTVFAAASLKTALDQVAAGFMAETGHEVRISYAGSGALARQIMAGAPADLFISAAPEWMDQVDGTGLVQEGTRRDFLGNRLVLVSAAAGTAEIGPAFDLKARLGGGKLAMALVEAVPAGQYGKAALEALGLWESVAPQVAQADNVRAALALVALGEAPLGVVYATDAVAEPRVHVVGVFPEESHPPITYPVALLEGGTDPADRAFYEALQGDVARAVFSAQGFVVKD